MWTLDHEGRSHRVEAGTAMSHHVRWHVDGALLAERTTWDDRVVVKPEDAAAGQLVVRYSGMGKPRRATLLGPDDEAGALTGLGGIDLVPEAGSPAAAYEDRVRLHPNRYAAIATVGGVAKVVVPLLLGLLVVRFAVSLPWPDVPLPDLPDGPDLPRVPWPDIPWPDLPEVRLPDWLRWLLDKAKYVWPVVLAFVLARAEIKRRRDQDAKRTADDEAGSASP